MKIFILHLILFSGFAIADTLKLSVQDFNFTYKDPHGSGSATSFSRNMFQGSHVDVAVDRIDRDLKFMVTGSESLEFELKNAPAFMIEAETMSVSNLNLSLAEKVILSLGSGRFYSKNDELNLDGLFLDCLRDESSEGIVDQLIKGCIQKMILKNSKFSSQDNGGLLGAMKSSISVIVSGKSDLGINSLEMRTTNGKYNLTAEIKSSISGKVKSNGHTSYDPILGKLTIKVSEIKFGILNITSKVFEELKKKETQRLKIKEPFIYYTIK